MLKATDQETVALKDSLSLTVPKKRQTLLPHRDPTGKHQGQRELGEYVGKSLYYGFYRKEWMRQEKIGSSAGYFE